VNRPSPDLHRVAHAWQEAATAAEPELDLARSRERFLRANQKRIRSGRRGARWWALGAAAAAVLLVASVGLVRPAWFGFDTAPEPGAWLQTGASEQLPLQFSEGSKVVVEGSSRVRVASVDLRGARMVVERGTVTASIAHRQDTRWWFEAGPFTVRVTGTELSVSWDPDTSEFALQVDTGSVEVTGPLLEQGRTIRGGQRCAVHVKRSHLEVGQVEPEPVPEPAVEPPVTELPPPEPSAKLAPRPAPQAAAAPSASWLALERSGEYPAAVEAAERVGLDSIYGSGSAVELMALARAARHAGRHGVARKALETCRERYPGTAQAATAAFLLGRSAAPAAAAGWFATYLREQPSGPLAREAAGRLVESYHRAGDRAGARDAAEAYLHSYPNGPHAAFARSVLASQTE